MSIYPLVCRGLLPGVGSVMRNPNKNWDRALANVGRHVPGDPENLEIADLAVEYQRVANELRVTPPENLFAASGQTHVIELLERASTLCTGLTSLPAAFKQIERLGRLRGGR